ncbi:hypothetical protein BN59_01562 [Legionella massiliensis]|uniref:Uncharacterized protein n=1 Tax=Legionella massiliensis TaxID=1034943 RepID=A0A078KS44_9GAMM|nr:hypothetical protein [Legionella massiliensis]CDZ77280.1 hypothetical protein BN59_01562 [Legionella massiliensis]CEE13018.1 hypothetical protein BN1094_01562 [Legionella massiliensis]
MYIKITFTYTPWALPYAAGGVVASLKEEPVIISELPDGAEADKYSEKLQSFIGKRVVQASFFHDCSTLKGSDIEKILEAFNHHYNNYEDGLPGADLGGNLPKDNEIIQNLLIATHNIVHPEEVREFQSDNSSSGLTWERHTY